MENCFDFVRQHIMRTIISCGRSEILGRNSTTPGVNTTTNQGVEGNACSAKRLRIGIFPGMPVGELF